MVTRKTDALQRIANIRHTQLPAHTQHRTVPNMHRSQWHDETYRDWVDEQSLDMAAEAFDAFANARISEPCTECGCTHKQVNS